MIIYPIIPKISPTAYIKWLLTLNDLFLYSMQKIPHVIIKVFFLNCFIWNKDQGLLPTLTWDFEALKFLILNVHRGEKYLIKNLRWHLFCIILLHQLSAEIKKCKEYRNMLYGDATYCVAWWPFELCWQGLEEHSVGGAAQGWEWEDEAEYHQRYCARRSCNSMLHVAIKNHIFLFSSLLCRM